MNDEMRQNPFGDASTGTPNIFEEFGLKLPEGVDCITWDSHPELMRKMMLAVAAKFEAIVAIEKARGTIRDDDV